MATWNNPDGLALRFGTDKTTPNKAGEYVTTGGLREIEVKIDLTALTETETVLSETTFFPKMRIQEVEVITQTVATSAGTPALDVGLVQTNKTTEIDYDGFVAALAMTAMDAAGETTLLRAPVSGTSVGDLIGTTTSQVGYITASRTTADAFTAGAVIVKIRYYAP